MKAFRVSGNGSGTSSLESQYSNHEVPSILNVFLDVSRTEIDQYVVSFPVDPVLLMVRYDLIPMYRQKVKKRSSTYFGAHE
jgi:hypothetical protein